MLPLVIVWFGAGELTNILLIAYGASGNAHQRYCGRKIRGISAYPGCAKP